MSSVSGNSAHQLAGAFPAAWAARARPALYALAMMLLWTAVVRLPFYEATDGDEFFFAVVARGWLNGQLPYVDYFDIKPPGLFFIFAIAQAIFGESQATIKGLEIVSIAVGGWALFMLLKRHASERAALWAAVLFPIYSLALGGIIAGVMLVQVPFLILGFWAVMSAIDADASEDAKLRGAFLAGLAIGAAGMIKQTALMEAIAAFGLLAYFGERARWRMMGLFVLGAALPALAFAGYFLAVGHFREMFEAVVVLALKRVDAAVIQSYGPEYAWYFTLPGATLNSLLISLSLTFLWGGAIFVALRFSRVREAVSVRLLVLSFSWMAAAFAGVVAGKALCSYYALTMVPPMLILAGALFCHGLYVRPEQNALAFCLSISAAVGALAYIDRESIYITNAFMAGDFHATLEASRKVKELGLRKDDRLLVLNRGHGIYIEAEAEPPGAYLHALHLLGTFNTPSADPLGEMLQENARFIVKADTSKYRITEELPRIERAEAYLAEHYRVAAEVRGAKDSFTIYEFVR